MNDLVIRVLAVAPYEGMRTAIFQAADAFPNLKLDIVVGDLEQGAELVSEKGSENYDAIISRGGTAELIAKTAECPVVEIDVTFYDVLRCIKLAQNYTDHFAVVGFPSITELTHVLCDLLQYTTRIITVRNSEDAEAALHALRRENYSLVLCDMVTHTIARKNGFDAFLITSGAESLRNALMQAEARGRLFSQSRQERMLLRSLLPSQNCVLVILRQDASVYMTVPGNVSDELLALCRGALPEIKRDATHHFYHRTGGTLHTVSARAQAIDDTVFYIFNCQPSQIQLRSGHVGIRTMLRPECEQLFSTSFYSTSGAMGELEHRISSIALSRQPVMILGEPGTGKEQIARLIYLRSRHTAKPFVTVNCRIMEDKSWDYLFSHHNSPLVAYGSTIYFQHLEDMPAARQRELLSIILETGLASRTKLIFSCGQRDDDPVPEVASTFAFKLGCLSESLPSLRRRTDEIPALAILYLNSLNFELGKQISGFEPHALEQLCHYDWPSNYTQFKHVLHELAVMTSSAYIRSSLVAELLTKERALSRSAPSSTSGIAIEGKTLEEITSDAIMHTLDLHGGNQSSAARQLGISRSTLWRYLGRCAEKKPARADEKRE